MTTTLLKTQAELAAALPDMTLRYSGGHRVYLGLGTTEYSFDRVPSGVLAGQWFGAYMSTYGNAGRSPFGRITNPAVHAVLDAAHESKPRGLVRISSVRRSLVVFAPADGRP